MPQPTSDHKDPVEQTGGRHDPGQPAYRRIERYEHWVDRLSWLSVVAFAVYVVLHIVHSPADAAAKFAFVGLAVASILTSYWFRFLLQPVADRQRRRLLIKDGMGVALTAAEQNLYWNNSEPASSRRLLMNLAENTFFVPRLLRAELGAQVALVAFFSVGLVFSVRFGTAEVVELFALLLVFSEVLLGKLIRLVWTLIRSRHLHLDIVAALRDRAADENATAARALYALGEYEYMKGRAGYRSRDRTFKKLNPILTPRWDAYRDSVLNRPS